MTAFDLGFEGAIEGAILLVLPLRVAATLLTPGLRRKVVVFPGLAAAAAASAAGLALIVAFAASSVYAWRAFSAFSLLVLAVEAWTSRPGYGRARGLPPGSLALAPRGPWIDPEFYATHIRRHGPVFKMRHLTSPQVCVADLALARDVLRRHDQTLRTPPLPFDRFVPGGFIRYLPPALHAERRAFLRAATSPRVVDAGRPVVRKLFEEGLRTLARDGSRRHPRTVLDPLVFRGSAHLFFGFGPGSPALARLEHLMRTIDFRRALWTPARRVRRALDEAQALLRTEPPAGFLGALHESDASAAKDPGILLNLIYMFNAGAASDTASLMSWVTWWVAAHPEWLCRLRESDAPEAMAERLVRETLRLSQSEYLVRRTTVPITVGGFAVPAGWLVRVCIREIHRRDDAFPDPGQFRPDRFLDPPDASRYAPFGASRVSCLGEGMTLMFGQALLLSMADRYDIRMVADGPPELGPFHWRPSGRFRIGLDELH